MDHLYWLRNMVEATAIDIHAFFTGDWGVQQVAAVAIALALAAFGKVRGAIFYVVLFFCIWGFAGATTQVIHDQWETWVRFCLYAFVVVVVVVGAYNVLFIRHGEQ